MSLKAFHIVFCVIVGAFLAGFGLWCVEEYQASESVGYLVMGVGAIGLGILIPFYMRWFLNKLRGMRYVVVLLGLFFSQVASACPVCIGNANDPMVRSANNGVVFLAILTGIVLVPFAGTMIYWGLRSRRLEKLRPSL